MVILAWAYLFWHEFSVGFMEGMKFMGFSGILLILIAAFIYILED